MAIAGPVAGTLVVIDEEEDGTIAGGAAGAGVGAAGVDWAAGDGVCAATRPADPARHVTSAIGKIALEATGKSGNPERFKASQTFALKKENTNALVSDRTFVGRL